MVGPSHHAVADWQFLFSSATLLFRHRQIYFMDSSSKKMAAIQDEDQGRNGPEMHKYVRRMLEELFDVLDKARRLDELLMIEPMAKRDS
jgi:hypothetical protein